MEAGIDDFLRRNGGGRALELCRSLGVDISRGEIFLPEDGELTRLE
jgi:hypothetical protein